VGQFGVRIEDILIVTTTGARVLTGYDHSLAVKE
jgi:Xaa-Pro aminopeptidase